MKLLVPSNRRPYSTKASSEIKRLSSGMAAALAGMSRTVFLLTLHRYGVAMLDLDDPELQSDLANA